MTKYLLLLLFCLTAFYTTAFSQNNSAPFLWTEKTEKTDLPTGTRLIQPDIYKTFVLDESELKNLLAAAPLEGNKSVADSETVLSVPLSDGRTEAFKIVEYSMMEPGLQAKYPKFKTYYGRGVDNPLKRIRFDFTAAGFRAVISLPEGKAYLDPYAQGDTKHYVSYFKSDYPLPSQSFSCGTEGSVDTVVISQTAAKAGDCQFRTYRLAMATTGEYSNFFGANDASDSGLVLSEVITSVNRVNEVYENDIAVRLILIANTDDVFYYDGANDPYTNNSGSAMLNENRDNLNAVIGFPNFDIGHVYSTGGGGIAQLRAPCGTGKARGVTGLPNPTNDPFYIDFVAHEIGHQFGGNHTFNGTTGSCGGNLGTATSVEPGSGTTIMAYAGICAPQNVQNNSDAYFHGVSITEFNDFITNNSTGNSCASFIANPNTAPTVSAGTDYTIPTSTPFVLTAIGNDADGDILTYCWEQVDTEIAPTAPPQAVNAVGPMFRSLTPVTSPQRYFPRLSSVINNTSTDWETLPAVARTMDFRVSARDNSTNAAGCTAEGTMTVTTAVIAGSFAVSAPNDAGVVWEEFTTQTVTWNPAGTTAAPISCANVDVRLSYDGGQTYPATLAAAVPNDGSQDITVPAGVTNTARVMVFCSDNIFYDISNNDFVIQQGVLPVEWLSFEATAQKNNIALEWITGEEIDNAGFTVERRAAHESDFYAVENVAPVENITARNRYTFIDSDVKTGTDYYYRIRQNDYDGRSDLSEIKTARLAADGTSFSLFPNPVKETLFGRVNLTETAETRARLYDVQGKLLRDLTFTDVSFSLSVRDLPAGFYLLRLENGATVQNEKVMVE